MSGRVKVSLDWTHQERVAVADLIEEDLRFLKIQMLHYSNNSLGDLFDFEKSLNIKRALILNEGIPSWFLELNRPQYSSYII
jgi:hypothetical protein